MLDTMRYVRSSRLLAALFVDRKVLRVALALLLLNIAVSLFAADPAKKISETVAHPSTQLNSRLPIGRIICRRGRQGYLTTATLIEDYRTVLAVSHFNFDEATNQTIPVENCEFQFLNQNGEMTFRSKFQVVARGSIGRNLRFSRATDWALLHLSVDAPASQSPLPVTSQFNIEKDRVDLVGFVFVNGRMKQLVVDLNCAPVSYLSQANIMTHQCNTSEGSSGAPLIAELNGRPFVIGMHAARGPEGGIALRIAGHAERSIRNRVSISSDS